MGYFTRINISSLVLICYFLIDRITKNYFFQNPDTLISWNFVKFHLVKNQAGIFGLPLLGGIYLKFIILLILLSFILYLFRPQKEKTMLVYGAMMMFTGGLSNLLDRYYHGFVIDFIDVGFWPVFNLSDTLITLGALLVLWRIFEWKE